MDQKSGFADATRYQGLYDKYNCKRCPYYGLFWAGSKIWTSLPDRDKTILLVIELKTDDLGNWVKMDGEVREILRAINYPFEGADRGICVRYYEFWDQPLDPEERENWYSIHRMQARNQRRRPGEQSEQQAAGNTSAPQEDTIDVSGERSEEAMEETLRELFGTPDSMPSLVTSPPTSPRSPTAEPAPPKLDISLPLSLSSRPGAEVGSEDNDADEFGALMFGQGSERVKLLSEEKVTIQTCLKEKTELLNITCRENEALQKNNDELKDIITLSRVNFEKFRSCIG